MWQFPFHGAEAASLTARVTIDTNKVEYVSGPSNSNFRNGRIIYTWTDPNGGETPFTGGILATFKLRAKTAGIAGFSISGDFYTSQETAINLSFSGTTVTIKDPEPEIPPVTTEPDKPEIPDEPEPDMPIEPDNPGEPEIPNQPEQPIEIDNPGEQGLISEPTLPSSPSELSIPNTSTTIDIPENQSNLSQNNNEKINSNTNLKSLRLDLASIVPNFSPDVLEYAAVVDETITGVDVLAVPEDQTSSISITRK